MILKNEESYKKYEDKERKTRTEKLYKEEEDGGGAADVGATYHFLKGFPSEIIAAKLICGGREVDHCL